MKFWNSLSPKKKKWIIIGGIVLIVALVAIGVYFFYYKKKKENASKPPVSSDPLPVNKVEETEKVIENVAQDTSFQNFTGKEEPQTTHVVSQKVVERHAMEDAIANGSFDWEMANDDFPLRLGSYGPKVLKLKAWLNRLFNANLLLNAQFDPATERALEVAKNRDSISEKYWNGMGIDAINV